MPRATFFAGLLVGLLFAVLLYVGGSRLYDLARAPETVRPAGEVKLPAPSTDTAARAPSSHGGAKQSEIPRQPEPRTTKADSPSPQPAAEPPRPAPAVAASVLADLAGKFPVVELHAVILDAALDADMGQLAVVGPFGESLGVYDTKDLSKPPRLVGFDGPVTSVAYKPLENRRVFVVGLDEPPRLALVDATALTVAKSVRLDTSAARQLVASLNPADPYLIYLTGPDLKGPRVFDLRQLEEVDSLGYGIVDAALSPDGRRLFYRSSSRNRAVGLFSERRTADAEKARAFAFEQIGNKLGSSLPMYVGPNDWFVAAGKHLYSNDLKKEYPAVSFEPQAFLTTKPWMAGIGYEQHLFCVGSINDCRTVTRIELPAGWFDMPRDAKTIGQRPRELDWQPAIAAHVFADEKNEQFLLAAPRRLASFPLAKLGLPAEQTLWTSAVVPETAMIGEPWSVQVQYAGKPDSVALGKHPSGMVLDKMSLSWTPQESDFGEHEIEIVAKSGDAERTEVHNLCVRRPSIEAPFSVSGGIDIAEDGLRAVVWGERVEGTTALREFTHLGVVDLASRTVVATRTMREPFAAAVLLDDVVYVLRRGKLERLSSHDLELRNDAPAAADRRQTLTVFGEGHRPWRFDLKTLDRLEADDGGGDGDAEEKPPEDSPAGPTGFGWVIDGVLWNEATGQPKLLLWPTAFRRTSWKRALRSSPQSAGEVVVAANTWHPCSDPKVRPRASTLRNKILLATVSPELPACLAITQAEDTYSLAALSLTDRREIQTIPLAHDDAEPARGDGLVGIETKGDVFIALLRGRLYPGSLRSLRAAVDEPFHVVPEQSVLILPPDRPTSVRYVSQGAERFHLESRDLSPDGEWFHAESATGEFTLSVSKSLDRIVETHVAQIANLPAVRPVDNEARLDNYLKPARREFLRMVGRPPDGVPIPVRVFVTAESAKHERASIAHDFLIEVPRRVVESALDKKYPLDRAPWREVEANPKPAENLGVSLSDA